jgi:hypothetical protein
MWATSLGLFVPSIWSVFSTFYDVCGLSRWHWIPLPTKAHHILTCVSMCMWKSITPLPTCMDGCYQCSIGMQVKSCSKWFLLSWQYFVIIGRFTFLVCHLTELEIWLSMLLTLWFKFKILCMSIVFSFEFWCGAHQLDLVIEHIMNKVVKNFFS